MKKLIVGIMVLAMAATVMTGCAKKADVKTGVALMTSVGKADDATAEKDGLFQVNTIVAAVSVDSDGKIVGVKIDKVQPKVNFSIDGKAKTAVATEEKSAVTKGDDYGMVKFGKAVAEWYKQMESLEKWMTGKTIAQVKAMKTVDKDGSMVTDEADLKSSVTVGVDDYIKAVDMAVTNAK